jgi:predicted RNA-binding protein with PUA-like domain
MKTSVTQLEQERCQVFPGATRPQTASKISQIVGIYAGRKLAVVSSRLTMRFLVKEEPEHYAFDAFEKDGGTTWTGVKNPLAQKHLRSIRKGDQVFYYHTGKQKAVVGIAKAAGAAYPDPADKSGKAHVVDLVPVKSLKRPVTLAELKADTRFKAFPLTRLPRLSVMPVSDAEWDAIIALSNG